MGSCKVQAGVDGKGWDCRHISGGLEETKKWGAQHPCTPEQAQALIKAGDNAACGNIAVQVGKLVDVKVEAFKQPYLEHMDKALDAAKGSKNGAKLADKNGENKAYWAAWDKKRTECKNTHNNMDRLKTWCQTIEADVTALNKVVAACNTDATKCAIK